MICGDDYGDRGGRGARHAQHDCPYFQRHRDWCRARIEQTIAQCGPTGWPYSSDSTASDCLQRADDQSNLIRIKYNQAPPSQAPSHITPGIQHRWNVRVQATPSASTDKAVAAVDFTTRMASKNTQMAAAAVAAATSHKGATIYHLHPSLLAVFAETLGLTALIDASPVMMPTSDIIPHCRLHPDFHQLDCSGAHNVHPPLDIDQPPTIMPAWGFRMISASGVSESEVTRAVRLGATASSCSQDTCYVWAAVDDHKHSLGPAGRAAVAKAGGKEILFAPAGHLVLGHTAGYPEPPAPADTHTPKQPHRKPKHAVKQPKYSWHCENESITPPHYHHPKHMPRHRDINHRHVVRVYVFGVNPADLPLAIAEQLTTIMLQTNGPPPPQCRRHITINVGGTVLPLTPVTFPAVTVKHPHSATAAYNAWGARHERPNPMSGLCHATAIRPGCVPSTITAFATLALGCRATERDMLGTTYAEITGTTRWLIEQDHRRAVDALMSAAGAPLTLPDDWSGPLLQCVGRNTDQRRTCLRQTTKLFDDPRHPNSPTHHSTLCFVCAMTHQPRKPPSVCPPTPGRGTPVSDAAAITTNTTIVTPTRPALMRRKSPRVHQKSGPPPQYSSGQPTSPRTIEIIAEMRHLAWRPGATTLRSTRSRPPPRCCR